MNLDRSIDNLARRIDRLAQVDDDGNALNHWRGKEIVLLNDWIRFRGTSYAIDCFPDDFDKFLIFLTESDIVAGFKPMNLQVMISC